MGSGRDLGPAAGRAAAGQAAAVRAALGRLARRGSALVLAVAALAGPPWLALRLAAPRAAAELVFVSGPEPETLDPALASGVLELRLLAALFEGLVRLDPETLAPEPAAAERVEIEPGFRSFRFELGDGLRWSDGEPLEAGHFLDAWRRAADPANRSPFQAEAARVAAVARVEGRRAIAIELDRPAPELASVLALPCFYPVRLDVIAAHGERWTRPEHLVGNGPFRLAEHRPGERLLFVPNPHARTPPRLRSIEALTTSGAAVSDHTDFLLYETGVADLVFSAPSGAREALAGRADLVTGPALRTVFLRINVTRPALADARVRRALALAIDRAALCERVTRGGEHPTAALVPAGLLGYAPAAGLAYDPEAARAEMSTWRAERAAAGLPEAVAFELTYPSSEELASHAVEVLQAEWRRLLGIEVSVRPMERKAFYGAMRRLDYDVCWSNWVADYPDPANFVEAFRGGSGNNRTGFADARFDALLDAARAAPRLGDRHARLAEAEARLLAAAPLVPLFHPERAVLVRPWVGGIRPSALNLVRWEEVFVDAALERARRGRGPRRRFALGRRGQRSPEASPWPVGPHGAAVAASYASGGSAASSPAAEAAAEPLPGQRSQRVGCGYCRTAAGPRKLRTPDSVRRPDRGPLLQGAAR